jgi:putative transcriptional regulator
MPIRVNLDVMLARQLSLLRTEKVRGIRFDTLSKICFILECKPADILDYDIDEADMQSKDED